MVDTSVMEFPVVEPPLHGADIDAASARYRIPVSGWLDLSAGINPRAYPLLPCSSEQLRRLPYSLHAAQEIAKQYCAASVLPVFAAGSQTLIQWLPFVHRTLHPGRRVAVPMIGYAEHAFRWQWAGYDCVFYDPRAPETIDKLLRDAVDVLVVITPHNPLAHRVAPRQLLAWHAALQRNNGWLVVDEAFIDADTEFSLAGIADMPGLVVLRSLGKFFGLAGVRCGYAFCHRTISKPLEVALGPWPLSAPALAATVQALSDVNWQHWMRAQLAQWSAANATLFKRAAWANAYPLHRQALFNSIELPLRDAVAIEDHFAKCAIRIRRIDLDAETALLRFGLVDPADTQSWSRLVSAIDARLIVAAGNLEQDRD